MAKYRTDMFREFMAIAKALSDENRVRALMFLRRGELCLCQIIHLLELSPSTVSKHMSILSDAGLVEGRKEGKWHYYRLAGKDAREIVLTAMQWADESLKGDESVVGDMKRLESVLRISKEELCSHYKS